VIYDNQPLAGDNDDPSTALGGGSIKVHKQGNLTVNTDADVASDGATLTQAMLDAAVTRAIAYWSQQGVIPERLGVLDQVDIGIADLDGPILGTASETSNSVLIDRDAAGSGWAESDEAWRSGGVDLLSAVVHEFGHILGMDHDVLDSTLGVGERNPPAREPLPGDANRDQAFNQLDLVQVLQAGKYRSDEQADWSQGDWNEDGRFDQLDIVRALQGGGYQNVDAESDAVFAELG
jgi:hypothetical protein